MTGRPSGARAAVPAGYETFQVRGARIVAQAPHAAAVRDALGGATLHRWAARQPGARALGGRSTAWSTTLGDGTAVVVRHSTHGGALAALTGDLFLAPTRAPHELHTAIKLARNGVRTPEVVAYAVYPALGPLRRADVVTGALTGADFPEAWRATPDEGARAKLLAAVAELLRQLNSAAAQHEDLNLKNVFIVTRGGGPVAYILDVDRVEFHRGGTEVAMRNLRRLLRSARKWREERGLDLDEERHLMPLAMALGAR